MLGLALAAALLQDAPSQDDVARKVAELVQELASDSVDTRDAAQKKLIDLGPGAEAAVEAALNASDDPEVQMRLKMVRGRLSSMRQETFALDCFRKGDPFPASKPGVVIVREKTFADAVKSLTQQSEIPIELYPGDEALARRARETPVQTSSYGNVESALDAMMSSGLQAAFVVDGRRVVIVSLTPALALARFELEVAAPTYSELEAREATLRESFEPPKIRRILGKADGQFAAEFLSIAKDAGQPGARRALAARELAEMQDADRICRDLIGDEKLPEAVLREALHGLATGTDKDALLDLLESKRAGAQKAALLHIYSHKPRWIPPAVLQPPTIEVERLRRLSNALKLRVESEDPDVAAVALAMAASLKFPDAASKLAKAADPRDRAATRVMIEALARFDFATARRRFGSDASAEIRLAYALSLIFVRGEAQKEAAEDARKLLEDADAKVRLAAANTLLILCGAMTAEEREGVQNVLAAHLETEGNAKVRGLLEKALGK